MFSFREALHIPSSETPSSEPLSPPLPVERYPDIEAPDTVTARQEIAVQVSLTSEQISPETKILSGAQSQGKLQLPMPEGERQWTLIVILTAPGMEIARGRTNTAEITIARDSDSSIPVFCLRTQPIEAANGDGKRDTRILATLWHDGTFLGRISRPLAIVAGASTASAASTGSMAPAQSTPSALKPSVRTMPATEPTHPSPSLSPAVQLDPAIAAPDLTIIESRVGNILRLIFYSASSSPVEADIPNPDDLHAWINAHFAQMVIDPKARERYLALAVLLGDIPIHPVIQRTLWEVDKWEALDTTEKFVSLSLAQRDGETGSIRLHDLQLDYVRAQYPDREALDLIHGALRLSLHVVERDPEQFASQMVGRLLPYVLPQGALPSIPTVQQFTRPLIQSARSPWLRPLRPALYPPGTALIRTLTGHSNWVTGVAVSGDGRRAVSASYDRTLKVWDLDTGASVTTFRCDAVPRCCAWAGDRRIFAGDDSGRVHFLSLELKEDN